jgi:hypothetical protein
MLSALLMFPPRNSFSRLQSLLLSLVLASAGSALVLPFLTSCTPEATTGEAPAADADMKKVIINVFGMT